MYMSVLTKVVIITEKHCAAMKDAHTIKAAEWDSQRKLECYEQGFEELIRF